MACPICETENVTSRAVGTKDVYEYDCPVCGEYAISRQAAQNSKSLTVIDQNKISAFIRERTLEKKPRIMILSNREVVQEADGPSVAVDDIPAFFPKTISERMERALKNLRLDTGLPGRTIYLNANEDYPVIFAEDRVAYDFLQAALVETGWIESQTNPVGISTVTITVRGWNKLAEIEQRKGGRDSKQAFVAMWFDPGMDNAYEQGFKKAVETCGYNPMKVNLKEHNDMIDDTIIAEIRKSRFLVADFTDQRHGVYFEAGYAMGLGLPVIWTCRIDDKDRLHFDTRQYNHILWKDETDLFERLRRRIEATIT